MAQWMETFVLRTFVFEEFHRYTRFGLHLHSHILRGWRLGACGCSAVRFTGILYEACRLMHLSRTAAIGGPMSMALAVFFFLVGHRGLLLHQKVVCFDLNQVVR